MMSLRQQACQTCALLAKPKPLSFGVFGVTQHRRGFSLFISGDISGGFLRMSHSSGAQASFRFNCRTGILAGIAGHCIHKLALPSLHPVLIAESSEYDGLKMGALLRETYGIATASSTSISLSSSRRSAPQMFSSRCKIDEVPGITNIAGDFAKSHASAT